MIDDVDTIHLCPWCGDTGYPWAATDKRRQGGVIEVCGACGLPRNRPEDALAIVHLEAQEVLKAVWRRRMVMLGQVALEYAKAARWAVLGDRSLDLPEKTDRS